MLVAMADRLTSLDASFLEIEEVDAASHMHIGWALVFDPTPTGAPSLGDVRTTLGERLGTLPRFASRLSSPRTGGLHWPAWVEDPGFDVADHVRRASLPAPGDLHEWLADYWSHRLDRTQALWEITLLDGLAGGRWALVTKTHHCLVDGVSGVDVTNAIFDGSRRPSTAPPASEVSLPLPLLVRGARAGLGALLHPQHALGRARGLAELVGDEVAAAPRTSLNVPISGTRRYALARARLDELKAVRSALGGTVNDVALSMVAGALRRLFEARGEALPDRPLRAMVPVSLRDVEHAATLGNAVSSLFIELPVAIEDVRERHAAIAAATRAHKEHGQAAASAGVVGAAGLAPPALHALGMRLVFSPRLFNLVVTNVPGPRTTLHAFGAPLREVLPFVPVFTDHALGLAITSYDGGMFFGVCADVAMHDIELMADGLEAALAELLEHSKHEVTR